MHFFKLTVVKREKIGRGWFTMQPAERKIEHAVKKPNQTGAVSSPALMDVLKEKSFQDYFHY